MSANSDFYKDFYSRTLGLLKTLKLRRRVMMPLMLPSCLAVSGPWHLRTQQRHAEYLHDSLYARLATVAMALEILYRAPDLEANPNINVFANGASREVLAATVSSLESWLAQQIQQFSYLAQLPVINRKEAATELLAGTQALQDILLSSASSDFARIFPALNKVVKQVGYGNFLGCLASKVRRASLAPALAQSPYERVFAPVLGKSELDNPPRHLRKKCEEPYAPMDLTVAVPQPQQAPAQNASVLEAVARTGSQGPEVWMELTLAESGLERYVGESFNVQDWLNNQGCTRRDLIERLRTSRVPVRVSLTTDADGQPVLQARPTTALAAGVLRDFELELQALAKAVQEGGEEAKRQARLKQLQSRLQQNFSPEEVADLKAMFLNVA